MTAHAPHRSRTARRLLRCASAAAVLLAALAVAPAGAHDGPSVRTEASVVAPGHRYVLQGEGWFVGPRCETVVRISQRESHGFPVGTARVRDNGTFTFSRRVWRTARRGSRIVLDVTQDCDGTGTTQTARFKVGRDRKGCGAPVTIGGRAYDLTVFGGLGCGEAASVIGAFVDSGGEPEGWACASADRSVAGHDYACNQRDRPGRRVTALRVRDV